MVPPPPNVARRFLSWDAPLLPQAVRWLAGNWAGGAPLDLSRLVVIVPTRQAGRRLRSGLAAHAAEFKQAVFPPQVLLPEALLVLDQHRDVASPLQTLLAWSEVLADCDLTTFRAIFPVDPPARSLAWTWRLAGEFASLQATLAEGGIMLRDVAARLPVSFPERTRWEQIGALEELHSHLLARLGRIDAQRARIAVATSPPPLADVERIVMLAVPDPFPLALVALAVHAQSMPVDVVVFAPESEAGSFDGWGRPSVEAWQHRAVPLPEFTKHVHLCSDAAAQAEEIAALAVRYAAPDGMLGLGLGDAEILPLAENSLARAGVPTFNPGGKSRRDSGFYHLLASLAAFALESTFEKTATLARLPDILAWLRTEMGGNFSAARWLEGLDDLWSRHLPATLELARPHACDSIAAGLERLEQLHRELRTGEFPEAVTAVLTRLVAGRRLNFGDPADAEFADAAEKWSGVLRECAAVAHEFPRLSREEWWTVALQRFGADTHEKEKPAGALDLQGWLELLWEDAPHLVVAGFNDGFVPDAVVGHAFLPESLRVKLGLKSNETRFARDAYLLHALAASRRSGGRLDLLLGKVSAAGNPLRPSRLLLQCADAELPARIEYLFRPLTASAQLPAWERPWQLHPRRAPPPRRISVTALRGYLECPFRFYLRHVLKMEAVDPAKNELDALDFGTLCHQPFERLKENPWRDCTDAQVLRDMLVESFDRIVEERFGSALVVPLVAQLESARQRLRRAAAVQAAERAAGWVTLEVERKFELPFGDVMLSGKIDRIDRHEKTGEWRVLDYKTTDAARPPAEAHLGPPRSDGNFETWMQCEFGGRVRAWTDLQLPLYLHALPQLGLGISSLDRPACGHFQLPKAIGDTAVSIWTDYTPELHEAAIRCVQGIVDAVRAEKFWPPNEKVRPEWDAFAGLFHRGAAESVAWEVQP